MKKGIILIVMIYNSLSMSMDKETAKKIFTNPYNVWGIYKYCKEDPTSDCLFIAQHLQAAEIHSHKRYEIDQYETKAGYVSDPIMRRPVLEKLARMRQDCPTCVRPYWDNLAHQDREKITTAVHNVLKANQDEGELSRELNSLLHTMRQ